jgi:hypothetical protein
MTSTLTNQSRNLVGATIGAFISLTTVADFVTWQFQHECIIAATVAAGLILFLGHTKQQGAKTTALCCVLGFACARLTISLIQ